jgi:Epoxide hydrolase N terminus
VGIAGAEPRLSRVREGAHRARDDQLIPIAATEADIADLRDRLRRTRWPEKETVGGWERGVPLGYLRELRRYWAEEYDWPTRQRRLNALPQFRTVIDGLGIHFIHVRSRARTRCRW